MYVQLGTTWLTNPNDGTSERLVTSSQGFKLNGKGVVEVGQFLRAISVTPFARGNLANTVSFSTTRRFSTLAAAESFAVTHASSLPTSGALTLICGFPWETQVEATAVTAAVGGVDYDVSTNAGITVTHTYSLTCGAITAAGVPSGLVYDGGSEPVDDTPAATVMIDGGNAADTFINCPTFDGGIG